MVRADDRQGSGMKNWNARKRIIAAEELLPEHRLTRSLSWPHLIALGVGALVGTGILTLIGVGADKAGPAVILSFLVAGVICARPARASANMVTRNPASVSAHPHTSAVIGAPHPMLVGGRLIPNP